MLPLEAGLRTLPLTLTLTQALIAANAGRLNRMLGARTKMSVGLLLLSAGLFGLAQIQVTTSPVGAGRSAVASRCG